MRLLQIRAGRHRGTLYTLGLALLLSLLLTIVVVAQQQSKADNLKVLDKNIPHDDLIALMNKFTVALGVGCDFCHAHRAVGDGRELDFASDANSTKLTAREMLKMVTQINRSYLAHLPTSDSERVMVECVTCHRGQTTPILLQDLLGRTRKEDGMAALDSVYRDLRKRYYGSGTYDFSDHVLAYLALDVSKASGPDALTILKLNDEFNPQSATNQWARGRVYVQLGDTASAVSAFKQALEINPDNRRVKWELDQLTGKRKP